jgi:hypothetical protein
MSDKAFLAADIIAVVLLTAVCAVLLLACRSLLLS